MSRTRRRLAVALVSVALIAPAVLDYDSFPLSTYPMYSRSRGDVVAVATANGKTPTGQSLRLSLETIGDIDDPLIVEAVVRNAIAGGEDDTQDLCQQIGRRLLDTGTAPNTDTEPSTDIDRIEVVTETHDVVDHASGRASLVSREIHATCEVSP